MTNTAIVRSVDIPNRAALKSTPVSASRPETRSEDLGIAEPLSILNRCVCVKSMDFLGGQ